jgi:hypothetical protein
MKLKRVQGTSEIGNIIMSIDNLYEKVETKVDKKSDNIDPKFKTFDDLTLRGEHALEQLEKIKNSIEDKQRLIARLDARALENRQKQ